MKYFIAFGVPFFGTLASALGMNRPTSGTDWVIDVVVALSAGFSGLAGLGINTAIKSKIGGSEG